MEWVLLFLLIVVGWCLGIAGFFQARTARREIAALHTILATRRPAQDQPPAPLQPQRPIPPPQPITATPEALPEPPPPQPEPTPPRPRPQIDIEVLLTQRWGLWLGSAALLLAAVFLVRTAAERGWLGPAPRCALAALLGVALAATAEWLRRRPPAQARMADLAPSALAAGATGAWFVAAYGAGPLYGLVSPMAGFILLAAASLAGLALSLRFGPLVAAAGLAGAFATPALVQTANPSLPGLFFYLLFVSAAAWGVVRYTAWAWLGWAAAAAGAAWVLLAATLDPLTDVWAPGLFVPAAAALSLAFLPAAAVDHPLGRRLSWAPLLLLGLAGLALTTTTGDETARLGVLILAPLAVAKGWSEPRLAWLPFLPATLFLFVLLAWALPAWHPTGEAVTAAGTIQAILPGAWAPDVIIPLLRTAAAMAAFFAAAGLILERRSPRPLPWAALAAAVPVATLSVTYIQVGQFQPPTIWALTAAALAAALAGAAALARPQPGGLQRAGTHAAGCAASLALGCAIVLDEAWLTLALALMLPALAWIEAAADLPPLRRVALAAAALVLVRLVLNPYVLTYNAGTWPILNPLLPAYGIPAAAFALAALQFRRRRDDTLVAVLEAGACAFTAYLIALEVHHWAAHGVMRDAGPGFREWAIQVSTLGALAAALQQLALRTGRPVIDNAWKLIGGLALIGGAALIAINPAITNDPVGPSLFANALLPAYAIPAALAILVMRAGARLAGPARFAGPLAAYAMAAAFTWVTLEVRQAFHPGRLSIWENDILDAELWAYSGAWLLLGAALMAAGLRTRLRGLRLAALALVGLAAAKAFLIDMAGLDGLWRVLSFLGLGLTLIGLGAFYRRFVVTAPPTGVPEGQS